MKSAFVFFLAIFFVILMNVPVFAGGAKPSTQKTQQILEMEGPPKEGGNLKIQQFEDKIAHSKLGKWVAKMGSKIFNGPRFNAIGYCMGFFLGFLGVLIVFLMDQNDTDKLVSAFWGSLSVYLIEVIAFSLLGYCFIHNLHFPLFQFDLGNII